MERKRLPDTRLGVVHKFTVGEAKGYVRTGVSETGELLEVFINMDKSVDAGPYGVIGILISMALQRGLPLRDVVRKLSFTTFEPRGYTSNKKRSEMKAVDGSVILNNLHNATSVVDYIVRWLWDEYGDGTDFRQEPVAPSNGGA